MYIYIYVVLQLYIFTLSDRACILRDNFRREKHDCDTQQREQTHAQFYPFLGEENKHERNHYFFVFSVFADFLCLLLGPFGAVKPV